ncbi:hypothetical protein LCGC14_1022650 [marine sediment metagenome]|uniref:Uncharacterized protein n=1 Tax=marine sediment metagenome TaxID=412755 RepID=A0A0F9NIK4_9ZZZZ
MVIVLEELLVWTDAENALLFEALTGLDTIHHDMPATKAVVAWDQAVVLSDELRYGPGDIVPWLNNSTFFDKIVRWGMRRRDWRYLLVEYEDTVLLTWFKTDVEYMPQGQVPFDDECTAACRLALWAIAADERV